MQAEKIGCAKARECAKESAQRFYSDESAKCSKEVGKQVPTAIIYTMTFITDIISKLFIRGGR